MRRRAAFWLAWSLVGLTLIVFAASVVLYVLVTSARATGGWGVSGIVSELLTFVPFLVFLAFPVVGALISSRRPENPIGWICLSAGLFWMLIILSDYYSAYSLARPGSVPFPVTIHALLYAWLWVPAVGLVGIFLVLLFPDGRLPSRRWRPLAWLSGAVIVVESVAVFATPGPLDGLGRARNPFGLEEQSWMAAAGDIVFPLLPLCMLASAVSLVLRFRRSRGEVRQQIKWIALAGSFVGLVYVTLAAGYALASLISTGTPGELGTQSWWGPLLENVMVLSFTGIPVAIGFAVLKHRLYDIDILINRTLVYALLTASLALLYLSCVAALQYVFRVLTGQETQLAVVASTLAIAALFGPLRRRVQTFVDRRFFRKKYDATKTLETFGATLRDETDLKQLNAGLLAVVRETLQPAHASLWLKPARTVRSTEEQNR